MRTIFVKSVLLLSIPATLRISIIATSCTLLDFATIGEFAVSVASLLSFVALIAEALSFFNNSTILSQT